DPQGLAIALGPGHPEVAADLLLRVAPLLVADDGHGPAAKEAEPRHDRRIIGEPPVALELDELRQEGLDVIERVGPEGMPRDLGLLPRRQARVDLSRDALELLAELLDLAAVGRVVRKGGQLLDSAAKLQDRLFEVSVVAVHASQLYRPWRKNRVSSFAPKRQTHIRSWGSTSTAMRTAAGARSG